MQAFGLGWSATFLFAPTDRRELSDQGVAQFMQLCIDRVA
jgi:hypothetical protein